MIWRKKRVALALNSAVVFGGVETHAIEFVTYMRDQGYEVTVLILRRTGKVAEEFERRGIRVMLIPVYTYDGPHCIVDKVQLMRLAWILLTERFRTIYCS